MIYLEVYGDGWVLSWMGNKMIVYYPANIGSIGIIL